MSWDGCCCLSCLATQWGIKERVGAEMLQAPSKITERESERDYSDGERFVAPLPALSRDLSSLCLCCVSPVIVCFRCVRCPWMDPRSAAIMHHQYMDTRGSQSKERSLWADWELSQSNSERVTGVGCRLCLDLTYNTFLILSSLFSVF